LPAIDRNDSGLEFLSNAGGGIGRSIVHKDDFVIATNTASGRVNVLQGSGQFGFFIVGWDNE